MKKATSIIEALEIITSIFVFGMTTDNKAGQLAVGSKVSLRTVQLSSRYLTV